MRCNMWIDSDQGGWIMNIDINIFWDHKLPLYARLESRRFRRRESNKSTKGCSINGFPLFLLSHLVNPPRRKVANTPKKNLPFHAILFHEWIFSSRCAFERSEKFTFLWISRFCYPGVSASVIEYIFCRRETTQETETKETIELVFLNFIQKLYRKFNRYPSWVVNTAECSVHASAGDGMPMFTPAGPPSLAYFAHPSRAL